jgi:TP53 regulating kinase-like protein
LSEARKAGVLTPLIYSVNVRQGLIVMQFVEGKQVKVLLNECTSPERQLICRIIGRSVGKLHRRGIIHGDLTTSNMIMSNNGKIFFLDFGLGERNSEVEAMGVDLHLMKRALESTHFQFADECFRYILQGYSDVVGSTLAQEVREKMMEIRRRGRYVSERKREP